MVIIALVATMLSDVVAAVFEVIHYGILADLDRGEDLSFETVDNSDVRLGIAYGAQALTYLGAGIAFLAWFHRAYRNLPRLGAWPLRFDYGWAVGAWLIPVFNWLRPKQLVNDVWRGSEPVAGPKRLEHNPRVPTVLHVWWAGWVLASVLGTADFWVASEAQTLPEQLAGSILALVADGAYIAAGVLAIVVVRRVTKRQEAAIAATVAAGPPPPIYYGWGAQPAPAWGPAAPPVWGQPPQPPPAWGQPQQPPPPPPPPQPRGPEAP